MYVCLLRNDFIEVQFRAFLPVFVHHDHNRIMFGRNFTSPISIIHFLPHSLRHSFSSSQGDNAFHFWLCCYCCWYSHCQYWNAFGLYRVAFKLKLNVNIWMIWNFIANLNTLKCSIISMRYNASISIEHAKSFHFLPTYLVGTLLLCNVWTSMNYNKKEYRIRWLTMSLKVKRHRWIDWDRDKDRNK